MALITCSDCGNQVSPRAASCPKCGAPIQSFEAPEEVLADAERRKSSGRGIKVISSLLMIIGIVVAMAGSSGGGSSSGMIGALMLFGGFFGFVIGRFMD